MPRSAASIRPAEGAEQAGRLLRAGTQLASFGVRASAAAAPQRPTFTIKTSMSGETLDRLLKSACSGSFRVLFNGLAPSENGVKKILRITFEKLADRENFRAALYRLAARSPSEAKQLLSDLPT